MVGANGIKIAAVSCLMRPGNPEFNLTQIAKWTKAAADEDADLVLFNETSATGYWMDERIRALAEPLDGPTVRQLVRLANAADIVIAAGIIEAAGDKQHNTHVLAGPQRLMGYHRKSSFPDGEEQFFDLGTDYNVIDVNGLAIGIAICFESVHPETCRKLAENGARVILAPYHNAVSATEIHAGKRPYFNLRARENGVWYVACDQCNLDHERNDGSINPGAVCFVDPTDKIVATTSTDETGEHMIVRDLEIPH